MKKIHLTKSVAVGILTILIGILIMGTLLAGIYTKSAVNDQYSNSMNKLEVAAARLADYREEAKENSSTFDAFSTGRAEIVGYYLEKHPQERNLSWLVSQCHVDEYYYLDGNGSLIESSGDAWQQNQDALKELVKDHMPLTIGDVRYYSSSLTNGSALIIGRKYIIEAESLQQLLSAKYSLDNIVVGETGYIEDISLSDGTIQYTKDETLIGSQAAAEGIDPQTYTDGYAGRIRLHGQDDYIVAKQVEDTLLIAIVPWKEIEANYADIMTINLIMVALTLFFLLIYAEMIRHEMAKKKPKEEDYRQLGKHLYLNKNILSRMKNIALMGAAAVFLMTYYIHTLSPLSHQGIKNELKVTAVSEILDENEQRTADLKEQYTKEYTERAQSIAYLIYKDPAMASSEAMNVMADKGGLDGIYLFDANGHVVSSNKQYLNYNLSTNEDDPSYEFWQVVNGYQSSAAQIDTADDSYEQYIGVSRLDSLGMVEIKISSSVMSQRLKTTELSYLLSHIAVVNNGFLFAVNSDTKNFDYIPEEKLIGHSALDFGMKESAFKDGYEGFQTISSTKYLMDGVMRGDDYIYCAVPLDAIYSSRWTSTLWTTLISALVIFAITMMLVLSRKPIEPDPDAKPVVKEDQAYFHHVSYDGKKRLVQSATSRYETHISWDDRTPEQKLYTIIGWTVIAASIVVVFLIAVIEETSDHSVLGYVLGQKWEKGINLFSLTFVVLTMLEIIVVFWGIRKAVLVVMKRFGARSETVGHLLDSFLKYAAVIGGLFYCLNAIGLDSTSLLASASILGLMLSFGAQTLIADVLAGISIVFEGEFRVGDIITIGDWRGTVVEIGIRTTKVLNGGHDVKIFNNSEIK